MKDLATKKHSTSKRYPLLPDWLPPDHPLRLNLKQRNRIRNEFDRKGIFLNIPYSEQYSRLEIAIIATVIAYGLRPRMARERKRLEARLPKITELMLTCRYGLTDLSYSTRMNMPFELGLLLAFGKETFVMSREVYSALRTASDLNFADIYYHSGRVDDLIKGLSSWVEDNCSSKRLSQKTLRGHYLKLCRIRQALGPDFDSLRPFDIVRLLGVAQDEFQMMLSG